MNFEMSRMPGSPDFTNRSIINVNFTLPLRGDFESVPNPYFYLCLTARDAKDTLGRNPSEEPYDMRCYKVIIQLPPRYVATCPSITPPSIEMRAANPTTCALGGLQPHTKVGVGQRLKAWIYFEDLNRDGTDSCIDCDDVEIAVLSDPGLPNDASMAAWTGGPNAPSKAPADHSNLEKVYFGDSIGNGVSTQYLYSRRFEFTPSLIQASLTYKICMKATELHKGKKLTANLTCPTNDGCSEGGRLSSQACFHVEVVQPDVRMVSMNSRAGPFGTASAVSPETAVNFSVRVQCDYKWTLQLYEALDFDASQAGDKSKAKIAAFERGIYSFTASADSEYGLPKGAMISAPRKIQVCQDMSKDSCTEQEKLQQGYSITEVDITWRPPRGSESEVTTTCLRLHEQKFPTLRSKMRCVRFEVTKCQVCVQNGDTLVSLARDYKTDWLQLWGANPHIANPNRLAEPGEQEAITLGPTHVIDEPVKLSLLAKRFRTTGNKVLELNPDLAAHFDAHLDPKVLAADLMVPASTHVCLMPEICTQKDDLTM